MPSLSLLQKSLLKHLKRSWSSMSVLCRTRTQRKLSMKTRTDQEEKAEKTFLTTMQTRRG